MKPLLSALLLLALPAAVHAQFTFTTNNGAITITVYTGISLNVRIPSSTNGYPVTAMADFAFYGLSSVTNVIIPDTVTNIGERALCSCTSLKAINVGALNPSYSSLNGVLFNKAQTVLLQYPGGQTAPYTITNSVTSIGAHAFETSQGLSRARPKGAVFGMSISIAH